MISVVLCIIANMLLPKMVQFPCLQKKKTCHSDLHQNLVRWISNKPIYFTEINAVSGWCCIAGTFGGDNVWQNDLDQTFSKKILNGDLHYTQCL